MRKFTVLILIIAACLAPVAAGAAKSKAKNQPVALVFGALSASSGAPVSIEITAAVIEQLNKSGNVEVMTFNPDSPIIARAILEKRLEKAIIDQAWEPKNAVRIARVFKSEYALCLKGSALTSNATVELQLLKVSGGGDWKTSAESEIAQGPREGTNRSNAVATAASSAVTQIMLEAFGGSDPILPEQKPAEVSNPTVAEPANDTKTAAKDKSAETPTAAAELPKPAQTLVVPARDVVAEYNAAMKQAEIYLTKKDMRNAVLELRHAINLDPETPSARVKLAGVYSDLGMAANAAEECKRALLFAKDNVAIHNMLVKIYLSDGKFAEAAGECREVIRLEPANIETRIALGDILWNQSKIDDAAAAYEDALKQDPNNATAHGRMQKLYSARKMYTKSLEHLLAVKVPSASAEPDASKRYIARAQVMQDEFAVVLGKLDSAQQDSDQGKVAREDYYQECKDAASRIDALATYLSTQTAPSGFRDANSHGVLAASLLSQASGYLVTYLETEKQHYKDQSVLLQNEAKTEMALFVKTIQKNG